jgi:V-type H+-transporting ATPase subunit D
LQGELDELEREEFFRLKKVQGNKKKHAQAAEAKVAAERKAAAALGIAAIPRSQESSNMLTADEDDDIIF